MLNSRTGYLKKTLVASSFPCDFHVNWQLRNYVKSLTAKHLLSFFKQPDGVFLL